MYLREIYLFILASVCACVCIYACMHVHVCSYVHAHVCAFVSACIVHMCAYVYTHVCVCFCICTCMYIFVHMCVHTYGHHGVCEEVKRQLAVISLFLTSWGPGDETQVGRLGSKPPDPVNHIILIEFLLCRDVRP